jgi:signal transduction histidine kinase
LLADRNMPRMPREIESALFRIVQEALTNVRKHSGSERVRITLNQLPSGVWLEVRDWGMGFDVAHRRPSSFGLRGIHERVQLMGGRCQVDSAPGEGTRLVVDLPLPTTKA